MSKQQQKPSALKREHPALQEMKFINLFYVCGSFLLSGTGSTDLIESGSGSETPTAELGYVGAVSVLVFRIFLYLVD
jgi:hypothetical protein